MRIESVTDKRILLSPLNWGMGHVSRCIGLIDQLRAQKNSLIIACSQDQQLVFTQYFDDLIYVSHDGYPFEFKGKGNFGLDLANKSSSLFRRLKKERHEVTQIIQEHDIDVVLSDHRYGFRSKDVLSVFITHQVNLPVRFHEKMINVLHNQYMSKFDHIWAMDYSDSKLAGILSESDRINLSYIGPYSRFSRYEVNSVKRSVNVLIASGPKAYAQQLVDKVLKNSDLIEELVVIHSGDIIVPDEVLSISNNWMEQDQVILKAKHLISRSGYSTIMDCHELNIDATLIPTKGQREQEYLAKRFEEMKSY